MKAYVVLFLILYLSGVFVAKLAEYLGFSLYACNFLYGIIIAMFAMENWSLLNELETLQSCCNALKRRGSDERNADIIVAELAAKIDALLKENGSLKESGCVFKVNQELSSLNRSRARVRMSVRDWRSAWHSWDSTLFDGEYTHVTLPIT